MEDIEQQAERLDPTQLMNEGRAAAQQAVEAPPEPTEPEPSELYTRAYAAYARCVWPPAGSSEAEMEKLLQESVAANLELRTTEGPEAADKLFSAICEQVQSKYRDLRDIDFSEWAAVAPKKKEES